MISGKLRIPSHQIASYCHEHHIRSLALFGSFARNAEKPDSDIDLLVDFEPGHVPGFDFFMIEASCQSCLVAR
jgi:predicted nucleotidyltransferase